VKIIRSDFRIFVTSLRLFFDNKLPYPREFCKWYIQRQFSDEKKITKSTLQKWLEVRKKEISINNNEGCEIFRIAMEKDFQQSAECIYKEGKRGYLEAKQNPKTAIDLFEIYHGLILQGCPVPKPKSEDRHLYYLWQLCDVIRPIGSDIFSDSGYKEKWLKWSQENGTQEPSNLQNDGAKTKSPLSDEKKHREDGSLTQQEEKFVTILGSDKISDCKHKWKPICVTGIDPSKPGHSEESSKIDVCELCQTPRFSAEMFKEG